MVRPASTSATRQVRGYDTWVAVRPPRPEINPATGTIHLETLADYSRFAVWKAVEMGAKGVWGYGSAAMRPGETPLHEIIKQQEDGTWKIDKVFDQMWIVPSIWGVARAIGREQGWDFPFRLLFNVVYGALSALGFSPRYVALESVKPPQINPPSETRFTTTLASGETVEVQVPMKMGFWTGRSLALHTWTRFRTHREFGQLELSLPLRLTKASVTRLYAANGKIASKMDFAVYKARVHDLRIVFDRMPIRPPGGSEPPVSMADLVDLAYRISYLAERERADEAVRKVPRLLEADHDAIPGAYLLALHYFLMTSDGVIVPVLVGEGGEVTEIQPDRITTDNFWKIGFYKRGGLPGGAPDPEGPLCQKSYRYTMWGNTILGIMSLGREGTLAYANRKLEDNNAVWYATGERVRVTSLVAGPWKIPWLNKEINVPGGRGSIPWTLMKYRKREIGLGSSRP